MDDFIPSAGYLDPRQLLDLTIATLTNVGALYLVIVMLSWTRRLRYSRTSLRPLVLSLALAKGALWFWTFTNVVGILWLDNSLPTITLPARSLWLVVVLVQVWVTVRIRPTPIVSSSLERELFKSGIILVVEDVEPLARVYRKTLEMHGFDAEFAVNGTDALTIIEQELPRMMIVDLGLPDMTGVELANGARALGFRGPIVSVTGVSDLLDHQKLVPSVFSEVVSKPIRPIDLVDLVDRWLRASR